MLTNMLLSILFFTIGSTVSLPTTESSHLHLAYDVYEPPEDTKRDLPPVVMLHEIMDSKKTWKHLSSHIANLTGRCVYCTDTRNHGESPWNDEMNFEVLERDLEHFLSERGIERAVFVGHGTGGLTALTLALQKPELVEKLFVEDTVTTGYPPLAKKSLHEILNLLRQSLSVISPDADEMTAKTAIGDYMALHLQPTATESNSSTIFDLDSMPIEKDGNNSYRWEANLDVVEKMITDQNVRQLTGVYDGPTFFLYGTESFFDVPSDEGNINLFFPNATQVPVNGSGHIIHQDFPKWFLQHLTEFINTV